MNTRRHWWALAALGCTVALGCASGSRTVRMTASADIPAAQGTVKTSLTDNDNTSLEVEVKHLAPPDRVSPGATTYVVWARPPGQDAPQNLGALRVDDNLRGTLKTVTPLQSFDVFITAEVSATVQAPSDDQLLIASIQEAR